MKLFAIIFAIFPQTKPMSPVLAPRGPQPGKGHLPSLPHRFLRSDVGLMRCSSRLCTVLKIMTARVTLSSFCMQRQEKWIHSHCQESIGRISSYQWTNPVSLKSPQSRHKGHKEECTQMLTWRYVHHIARTILRQIISLRGCACPLRPRRETRPIRVVSGPPGFARDAPSPPCCDQ